MLLPSDWKYLLFYTVSNICHAMCPGVFCLLPQIKKGNCQRWGRGWRRLGSHCTRFLLTLTAKWVSSLYHSSCHISVCTLSVPQLCHFRIAEAEVLGHWAMLAKLTLDDSGEGPLSRATEETLVEVSTLAVYGIYCAVNAQCSYSICTVHMFIQLNGLNHREFHALWAFGCPSTNECHNLLEFFHSQ